MNHASLNKSPRLQRVYNALITGPKTTKELIEITGSCAINSIAAELRAQGVPVACQCISKSKDAAVYQYRLERLF
jgi:hypothetical protein